jgi:aspartate-semialdehyde dehydrogenase
MSRESSTLAGQSIAIVGAEAPIGQRFRAALERRHVDGGRVHLFAAEPTGVDGEAILTEYAGEPRLIQEPDSDIITPHPWLFLCGGGEVSRRLAESPPAGKWVIDLFHDRADDDSVDHLFSSTVDDKPTLLSVPHPISLAIASLLEPLTPSTEKISWSGWVMRPAADFGEAGVDELREQTVQLLNFTSSPREVFGRQLAFNLLPQPLLPGMAGTERARIRSDVERRFPGMRGDLQLAIAPMFFGHVISLHLRCSSPDFAREIPGKLGIETGPPEEATPVELAAERGRRAVWWNPGTPGEGWLWAVIGDLEADAMDSVLDFLGGAKP